ncbi:hypothetical protein AAG906_001750 [Vitis piasezkii]
MSDIERYTGIGCPRMIMLFPLFFPSNSKGKMPRSGPRPSDVRTIGMMGHRSPRRPQTQRQFSYTSYKMIQHDQYRPAIPIRPAGPAYLHLSPQPVYATQASQRPPMQFHHSHSLGCH